MDMKRQRGTTREDYLTLEEACVILRIVRRTAQRWIKSGKLKTVRPGHKHLVPRSAIECMLKKPKVAAIANRALTMEPK